MSYFIAALNTKLCCKIVFKFITIFADILRD